MGADSLDGMEQQFLYLKNDLSEKTDPGRPGCKVRVAAVRFLDTSQGDPSTLRYISCMGMGSGSKWDGLLYRGWVGGGTPYPYRILRTAHLLCSVMAATATEWGAERSRDTLDRRTGAFRLVSRVGKGLAWVLGRLDGMVWEGPEYAFQSVSQSVVKSINPSINQSSDGQTGRAGCPPELETVLVRLGSWTLSYCPPPSHSPSPQV